jgi:hypothetical protein
VSDRVRPARTQESTGGGGNHRARGQVVTIDAQAVAMVPLKPTPQTFVTDDDVARWQEKLDALMAERARLMNERRPLLAVKLQKPRGKSPVPSVTSCFCSLTATD